MHPAVASGLAVLGLASVHLFSPRLRVLSEVPRSRLLSAAGGISVAYVMLRILPALSVGQATLEQVEEARRIPYVRNHIYVIVLFSLVGFYGLERLTKRSREEQRRLGRGDQTTAPVFWVKIGSFATVNALIGYLLVWRGALGAEALLLFFIAFVLKFLVNDHGLYADHKAAYLRIGRWLLALAVLAGWLVGLALRVPPAALAVLQALVAGSILLNVLKEELPEYRESRYWAFVAGAAGYAALLLAI